MGRDRADSRPREGAEHADGGTFVETATPRRPVRAQRPTIEKVMPLLLLAAPALPLLPRVERVAQPVPDEGVGQHQQGQEAGR